MEARKYHGKGNNASDSMNSHHERSVPRSQNRGPGAPTVGTKSLGQRPGSEGRVCQSRSGSVRAGQASGPPVAYQEEEHMPPFGEETESAAIELRALEI